MKQRFEIFINRFSEALKHGALNDASEETVRTWINEMLGIFGWDVQNTHQILQERTLDRHHRELLHSIGSSNTRPDYTFVNGNIPLAFLDAKNLDVPIERDNSVAFQIRSYGWSIGASYSIVTNMKEMAIYDCRPMPNVNDPAAFARIIYLTSDNYVQNFDVLKKYLDRSSVISNSEFYYSGEGESVDVEFTRLLSDFRIHLIEDIIKSNENLTIQEAPLTLWAQIIIDRLLFIRVCESRGIERDGLLNEFASTGFWENFKNSSYFTFYEKYDGPLFGRNEALHNLTISNDVFDCLLRVLYYPSPYRFDVIPLKTISDIYDKFLGYTVVVEEDGKVSLKLKEEYRKSKGAVTTPQNLVIMTIENILDREELCKLSLGSLLSLRFIDPACGSGVFLVTLFDCISEIIIKKIKDGESIPSDFFIRDDDRIYLTIEGKRKIIQNCIYGVDIDMEAVEVAKMSLSLRVVDGYQPSVFEKAGILGYQILNGIGTNIKCGNTLVTPGILDFDESLYNRPEEIKSTRFFDWKDSFSQIFDCGGFDYVIGNPPYVEVKNYNSGLPTMAKWIKEVFPCSKKGKVDLSIPFIEQGMKLLKPGGRLSYIVQKRFFKTDYGKAIRELIRKNHYLYSIFEFEDNDMFARKITYVAILSLEKRVSKSKTFIYRSSSLQSPLEISTELIDDDGWSFDNIPLLRLRNQLTQRLGVLKDRFEVKVGIQVLWTKAYHIKCNRASEDLVYGMTGIDSDVEIEKDACRELICNEQFSPYALPPRRTFAIFPYDITDNGVVAIPFSEYQRRFPKAAAYLLKHKETITTAVQTQPERNVNLDAQEYWHIFTRSQNLDTIGPKVVVPMTTFYPIASMVKVPNVYCDNVNVNFIQFSSIDEDAYVLSGLINSKVFGVLARNMANPSSGNYAKYNKEFLKNVPLPVELFENKQDVYSQISDLVKKIERIAELIRNVSDEERKPLRIALDKLYNKLDIAVSKAYELSDDEVDLINSQCYYER
ncbi:MAG: N-6 DNA methylase [Bacteroidales bacterium]|nr:N-6 DNA methylase [Bacteroidales bacterium]